jgi:hypothetical protein
MVGTTGSVSGPRRTLQRQDLDRRAKERCRILPTCKAWRAEAGTLEARATIGAQHGGYSAAEQALRRRAMSGMRREKGL